MSDLDREKRLQLVRWRVFGNTLERAGQTAADMRQFVERPWRDLSAKLNASCARCGKIAHGPVDLEDGRLQKVEETTGWWQGRRHNGIRLYACSKDCAFKAACGSLYVYNGFREVE